MKEAWQKRVLLVCGIILVAESIIIAGVWGLQREETTTDTADTTTRTSRHRSLSLTSALTQQQNNNNNNIQTIINVGLPRTGSEFLYDYLVCQGISSRHRSCCNDGDNAHHQCRHGGTTCGECIARNLQTSQDPPWKNCASLSSLSSSSIQAYLQVDVETSDPYSWFLPQRFALEALTTTTADVLWILTLRANATIWAESVLHWHSITQRLTAALDIRRPLEDTAPSLELPRPVTHDQVVESLKVSVARAHDKQLWKDQRDLLMQAYTRHVQHVRTTAQALGVPLVEVVIDDQSATTSWQQSLQAQGIPLQSSLSSCWKGYNGRYETDWQDFSFSL